MAIQSSQGHLQYAAPLLPYCKVHALHAMYNAPFHIMHDADHRTAYHRTLQEPLFNAGYVNNAQTWFSHLPDDTARSIVQMR